MSEESPHDHAVHAQMRDHVSVRRYEASEVPRAHLERAVEAARMAATSSWIQAWTVLRITSWEERERLSVLCGGQQQVLEAGAFLVLCADSRRHRLLAREAGVPHATNLEAFLQCSLDLGLFAQNLALALEAQGYGTCMIGGLRNQLEEVVDLLEVPEGVWPLFGLCVGTPAETPLRRPRLPVNSILVDDRVPTDRAILAGVEAFDEDARAWYSATGREGRTWSQGIQRTFGQLRRVELRATLEALGASFD